MYTLRMEPAPANLTANHLIGAPLPWITANLPGIGGTSKGCSEDFRVEEIPAYPPEGAGEFLFLWVEKTGLSAEQLTSHLARTLKIAHQDIGMAGMKDRQAVTLQMVSVPARCEPLLASFEHEQTRILEVHRHRHKLRTGHLKGNRFSILVRDVCDGALEIALAIAAKLEKSGVPNFFGDQRFGRDAETLRLGLELLKGTKSPGAIPRARRKFLLRLALSAAQSALFNRALVERFRDDLVHKVITGDVMQVTASGGPFVVENPVVEQSRFDAREIVISGPIFGPKMKQPSGEVVLREDRLLADAGIPREAFERFSNLTPGTRRPYLIWLEELKIEAEADGIRLAFTLPSGCYATVALREFQKNEET
jgi:tRNA pseudouridine13 synthase